MTVAEDIDRLAAEADVNLGETLVETGRDRLARYEEQAGCCEGVSPVPTKTSVHQAEYRETLGRCEPRLADVLREIASMSAAKGKDYASDEDCYSNMRAAGEWGLPDYQLCCMRIDEKVRRIKNYCQRGYLINESLEDSLKDIALLACIATILFREAGNGQPQHPATE